MINKKIFLKVGFGLGVIALLFVALSVSHHANAVCSPYPDCLGGGTTKTPAPTLNSVTWMGGTQINLSWTDNDPPGTFFIYRSTDNVNFTLIASTTATSYSDYNTTPCGNTFYYGVKSIGSGTLSAMSNVLSAATICAPAAPTLNSVTAVSQTQINVTFTDNSTNEFGFYVFENGNYVTNLVSTAGTGTVTTWSAAGLTCGTTYSFYVQAENTGGLSNSATMSATTNACVSAPAPVSSVSVSPVAGNPTINTTWASVSDGIRLYAKGPSGYSLVGDFSSSINKDSMVNMQCPFPYTLGYIAYNNDPSIAGITDSSCTNAFNTAGIVGPVVPTGVRCSSATLSSAPLRFCTQQFLGN